MSEAASEIPSMDEIQPEHLRHQRHGLPTTFSVYRTAEGETSFVVGHYETGQGMQSVAWIWHGSTWNARGFPKNRCLYGLPYVARMPDQRIIVVQGEVVCDAAQIMFPINACVTWSGDEKNYKATDWSPIAGRECVLWPTNTPDGFGAMAAIAGHLMKLKCRIWIVNNRGLADGWDLTYGRDGAVIQAYAETHWQEIAVPPPQPPAITKVTHLKTATQPDESVIHIDSIGSLYETYSRYGFNRKSNGRAYCNEFNVGCALNYRNATDEKIDIYYDEFSERVMVDESELTDGFVIELMGWLQNHCELFDIGPKTVRDGLLLYARQRRRNPPKEWLLSLQWDQTCRLQDLLTEGFGCPPTDYHADVGRCFIVGMVARVLNPGCKVDCMPVFEGPQGGYKSSALGIIGGEYFSEIHDSIMSKDFYISLQGKMLCEISELHAFKTADIERIKGIISNRSDRYRAPYASAATDHPRQGVFSGTTNRDDWNTDETGARRFWPVECGDINKQWLKHNREQLFAEAVERYQRGEQWWDVPEEDAESQRAARQDIDAWEEILREYLKFNSSVRLPYIMEELLKMRPSDMDMGSQKRIGRILRKAGFVRRTKRDGDVTIKTWMKKNHKN